MRYKRYPKYKNSGIEWIGEIPEGWETKRSDAVFQYVKSHVSTDSLQGRLVFHYSIPAIEEIGDGEYQNGDEILSDKLLLTGNELLVSKLNPRKGRVFLVAQKECPLVCSTEFVPLLPKDCCKGFAYYLYSSDITKQRMDSKVQSATRSHQRVNPSNIIKMWNPFPPVHAQQSIATFLDHKTSQIDSLIADKQRLIELLEEKRSALITQAVTKGLDPDVPMKDSGVEWIGEIPEGWKVSRVKYQADINKHTLSENANADLEIKYIDIGSVNSSGQVLNVETLCFETAPSRARRIIKKGDTIVSTVRTYLRAIASFEDVEDNLICSTGFAVLSPRESIDSKYLAYLIRSTKYVDEIVSRSVGVSYPAIAPSEIGALECLLPPIYEQQSIINYLNRKTSQIDSLITEIQRSTTLFEEYKQSLITAAVTGKIDVRDERSEQIA